MKKLSKVIVSSALTVAAISTCAFGACAQSGSYEGEYSNTKYGTEFGVKVEVVTEGDRIREVKIVESNYVTLSPESPNNGWGSAEVANWNDNLQTLLDGYRAKNIADVLALNVAVADDGDVLITSDTGFVEYNESLIISGATQSSGRLLLAVQNALSQIDGYQVLEGEYSYPNAWNTDGAYYGIKVKVVLKGNVVQNVTEIPSEYVSVTDTWSDKAIWNNNYNKLFANYRGKTIEQLMAYNVVTNANGQPLGISEDGFNDFDMIITGATQGSGRVLLAVQDALYKTAGYQIVEGEYKYNAWSTDYGIKVRVVVKDGVVQNVTEIPCELVSVSAGWEDKNTWITNLKGLLANYRGKTVAQLKALTVAVNDNGQPLGVEEEGYSDFGLIITGATQGSGRLLLAVKNALTKLV